jgi:hypothetical protein
LNEVIGGGDRGSGQDERTQCAGKKVGHEISVIK